MTERFTPGQSVQSHNCVPPHIQPSAPILPTFTPEPTQLGQAQLTMEERERRLREQLCIYCGQPVLKKEEAGIIQPSSSPAGAGFFFVSKKEKSLHPCIDYHGLNNRTENWCPI